MKKPTLGPILLVACLLFSLGEAYAATYYVDYTQGGDSGPGTINRPLKYHPWMAEFTGHVTLQPGDTVYMKRGETWSTTSMADCTDDDGGPALWRHCGLITAWTSGAPGHPITTTAYGAGAQPLLHIAANINRSVIFTNIQSYLVFDNLHLQGSVTSYDKSYSKAGVSIYPGGHDSHDITVTNCEINNVANGVISFWNTLNLVVGDVNASQTATTSSYSNHIHDFAHIGVGVLGRDAATQTSNAKVYYNYIHNGGFELACGGNDLYGITTTYSIGGCPEACSTAGPPTNVFIYYNNVQHLTANTAIDSHAADRLYIVGNYVYDFVTGAGGTKGDLVNGQPSGPVFTRNNIIENPPDQRCTTDPKYHGHIAFTDTGNTEGSEVSGNIVFWTTPTDYDMGHGMVRVGAPDSSVFNNIVYNCPTTMNAVWYGDGAIHYNGAGNADIFNNTVYNCLIGLNMYQGIDPGITLNFKNNIISYPGPIDAHYIYGKGTNSGTLNIDHNSYYNSTDSNPFSAPGTSPANWTGWRAAGHDAHSLNGLGLFFVGTTDFHLKADSAEIGAGTIIGAPATDFDRVSRLDPPSIGAYEPDAFAAASTHYNFTYPDKASLLAAGWSFLAVMPAGGNRNTEQTTDAVVSYDQAAHPGILRIPVDAGDMWGNQNNTRNTLLRNLPPDWTSIRLKLSFAPTQNYQQAGLLAYQDDDNYVQVTRIYGEGNAVTFAREINGGPEVLNSVKENTTGNLYLRLDRDPSTQSISASYSRDGSSWLALGSIKQTINNPKLAIFAGASPGGFPNADLSWAEVYTLPPAIALNPAGLRFSGVEGTPPASQTIALSNRGGGTMKWTATADATAPAWLSVSPASGTDNATLTVSVNSAGLSPGTYTKTITVSAPRASNTPRTVNVTLTVNTKSNIVFAVNSAGVQYTSQSGVVYQADTNYSGGYKASTTAAITGTSDVTLYQSERYGNFSYNIPLSNGNYIVTLKFAEMYWNGPGYRVFNVSMQGIQVISNLDIYDKVGKDAAYDVLIPVSVASGTLNINFTSVSDYAKVNAIEITQSQATPPPPAIALDHTGLSFSAVAGTNPANQTIALSNSGGGTLNWTAAADGTTPAWLSVSPANGTGDAQITVSVNIAGLAAGTYTKAITITANGATNSPQTVNVTLTVNPVTTTHPSGHYDFNYPDRASLLAAGWDFLAVKPGGGSRNTEQTTGAVVSYDQTAHTGILRIPADAGDMWGSQNNTRNTLLRSLPADWTSIRLKLSFAPTQNYQQAGLLAYQDDNNYVNLTRIFGGGNTVTFAREINGYPGVLNSVPETATGNLYLRLDRDLETQSISAYYSKDGSSWITMGSVTQALINPRLAIFVGASPGGFPNADLSWAEVISAPLPTESHYNFTYPDRTSFMAAGWSFVAVTPSGSSRNTEQTTGAVVSYDQAAHPGILRIPVDSGDLWAGANNTRNTLLRDLPENWTSIRLKLSFAPTQNYQQAGLLAYQDDDNYVQVTRIYGGGNTVTFAQEINGYPNVLNSVAETATGNLHLRLDRAPATNSISAYYSKDGSSWITMGSVTQNLTNPKLAIFVGASPGGFPNADLSWAEVIAGP